MKMASGNGENEGSGKKKVRFFDGNDQNFVDLDSSEGEEEVVLPRNGDLDSKEVGKNGNGADIFDVPSVAGTKRVSGNGENEELGKKKVRFLEGIDQNYVDLNRNEGEEERVVAENGVVHSEEVDNSGNQFGIPSLFDVPSLGGEGFDIGDNINFDMFFGYEEEQRGVVLDLNCPLYDTYPNRRKKGLLAFDQYPNKKVDDHENEIVDLVSDDDDSDLEVVGYSHSYNPRDQGIESGMPSSDRVENLDLGLGLLSMDNGAGAGVGECSYAREEAWKGSKMESWLSLKASPFVDLDPDTDSDDSIELFNPAEVEFLPMQQQPEALAAPMAAVVPEVAERRRVYRRDIARHLARVDFTDKKSGELKPPAPNPIEQQLGKLPGPFSDALKIVRERVPKQGVELLIKWKPLEKVHDRTGFIPSLLNLSLKALARSAEGIVSLEMVPDNLLGRLSNILCDTGKIDAHFLELVVEGCPTELRLKNCSWITEELFQQTLGKCRTNDLRVLQLDLCGQCWLDIEFTKILDRCSSSFSRLTIVSLRGACRLSDNGLRDFVSSAPLLRSINLGQCTLLTSDAVHYIADVLGSDLRELYIDECLKIDANRMLPAFKKFRYLEVLSVAELHTINDDFVEGLVSACGQGFKELDFCNCTQLTDYSLKMIGESCTDLRSLNISNLNNLTDLGLENLANGCRSIQQLKIRGNNFSDEAVAAFIESSGECLLELLLNNLSKVGPQTALSLAKCSRKLLSLDVSWCRRINNEALGLIVDSCSSLKQLKIFGCRQITELFLKGHSNPVVRIIGSKFTRIMDDLDLLEPEEVYFRYSPLAVYMED